MSIVPYANNRQVVLRHNDQVVVYDPQSKEFGVRDATSQRALDFTDCPYCHQPLRRDDRSRSADNGGGHRSSNRPGFVSPGYFRMLRESLPGSANSSPPASPRRRLVEPVRTASATKDVPPAHSYSPKPLPHTEPTSQGISASALSPGYFNRFFVVERELGRGGKGVVLLVTHILDNVDLGQYACKRVPVGNDHQWLIQVLNEVRLLEHLSHQHLVYYKHVWLEEVKISTFGPSVPCAFILQQYCNAGDLHGYLVGEAQSRAAPLSAQMLKERARRRSKTKSKPDLMSDFEGRKLRLEEIYSFFKDITSGLNHLHLNGFIHRDLKPSNCLLHDAGMGLRVLVSDFGEVQLENMVRKSTGATGTVSYCAPEVLRRSPLTGELGQFTTKSDIFSLGMILYFLCFARLPYHNADHLNEENEDLDQLREEIINWTGLHEERKLRPDLPEQLYTFLRRLLSLSPEDRPSAEEILLGIKTGTGLDEISDICPPTASAHRYDDLSASSRISPIESPRPSTPAAAVSSLAGRSSSSNLRSGAAAVSSGALNTTASGFTRPSISSVGPTKLRMSSFQRDRSSQPSSPTSSNSYSPSPPSKRASPENHEQSYETKKEGQLIVRSSQSPPPSSPSSASFAVRDANATFPTPLTKRLTKEIMAPPPPALPPWNMRMQQRFLALCLSQSFTLALLLAKLVSLHQLCAPLAANPLIAYPLLALAASDALLIRKGHSSHNNQYLQAAAQIQAQTQAQLQAEVQLSTTYTSRIRAGWTSLLLSLSLAVLHVAVLFWASKLSRLCEV